MGQDSGVLTVSVPWWAVVGFGLLGLASLVFAVRAARRATGWRRAVPFATLLLAGWGVMAVCFGRPVMVPNTFGHWVDCATLRVPDDMSGPGSFARPSVVTSSLTQCHTVVAARLAEALLALAAVALALWAQGSRRIARPQMRSKVVLVAVAVLLLVGLAASLDLGVKQTLEQQPTGVSPETAALVETHQDAVNTALRGKSTPTGPLAAEVAALRRDPRGKAGTTLTVTSTGLDETVTNGNRLVRVGNELQWSDDSGASSYFEGRLLTFDAKAVLVADELVRS